MLTSQLVNDIFKSCGIDTGIYNEAFKKLCETEEFLKRLDELLSEKQTAQEIIDSASVYLNNPFFYLDRDYSIIAMTLSLDFEYDEEWEYMKKHGYLSPLTARLMKESGNLEYLAENDNPVSLNNPLLFPFGSINCNVRLHGQFMGRLTFLGALRDLNSTDFEAVRIVIKHLVRLLEENERVSSEGTLKKMLKDILAGVSFSSAHTENILIEAGFPVTGVYALYVIDTNSAGDPQVPVYYESALERTMIGETVLIFTYGDSLILIACAHTENGFAPIEFKLNAFLIAQSLSLGAGNYFKNFSHLFGIYSQALAALKLGTNAFTRYRDIMVENILSYIPDADIQYVISDEIYRLLEADAESSFSMTETLKVYLDCGRSLQKSADTLYIHKNTMLYRLSRIKEVLGCDIEDTGEALRLGLSLRLIERGGRKFS